MEDAAGEEAGPPRCQVDGCGAELCSSREYFQRQKICEKHAKADVVGIAGKEHRFCQQCTRLEPLCAFEGSRRSCRAALARRQERLLRRKRSSSPEESGSGSGGSRGGSRRVQARTSSGSLHRSSRPSTRQASPVQQAQQAQQQLAQPQQLVPLPSPFYAAAVASTSPAAAPKGLAGLAGLLASLTSHGSGLESLTSLASLASSHTGLASLASIPSSTGAAGLALQPSPADTSAPSPGAAAATRRAAAAAAEEAAAAAAASLPVPAASPPATARPGTPGQPSLALPEDPEALKQMLVDLLELQGLLSQVAIPEVQKRLAATELASLLRAQRQRASQGTSAGLAAAVAAVQPAPAPAAEPAALLPLSAGDDWEQQRMSRSELVSMLGSLGGQLAAVSLLPPP